MTATETGSETMPFGKMSDVAMIEERNRRAERAAEFEAKLAELAGSNKGVVVAEYRVDDSDLQSDYWGHTTSARVILGFTKTARNLFPNMRKHAATWENTAHLATAPKKAEHRENWSMGGGNYLKDGSRHGTGWSVSIIPLEWAGVAAFGPATGGYIPGTLPAREETADRKGAPGQTRESGAPGLGVVDLTSVFKKRGTDLRDEPEGSPVDTRLLP
jgi:hypothetical protein